MCCTLKDSFESTLPTDRKKQKPQIAFLRFLCYNGMCNQHYAFTINLNDK